MGELRTAVLQNRATIDYLLLKNQLGCKQFSDLCYFNISDFSHTIDNHINKLQKEIDKISYSLMPWPEWLLWITPFLGPIIIGILLLLKHQFTYNVLLIQ